MKKLFSILCLAAAGLWFGSCEQDHIDVIYHPSDVVAPATGTLSGPEGGKLSADGAPIVLNYTKADYGVATNVNYSVYVDLASAASAKEAASVLPDLSKMTRISAAVVSADPATITIPQKDLNSVLLDWGILPGQECTVRFIVVTNLATEKGTSVEGTEFYSDAVIAPFIPYNAEVNDVDKYEHVWVIGDFNGWNFDNVDQYLYAYKGGSTYTGLIDFGEKAANGFKLTGIAGWDDSCNWATDGNAPAPEAEAASIQLISSGGSKDIMCYSKRFYMFEFDKTSLVLKKSWSADRISIIGLNGDWNSDIVMEYNAYKHRFYKDIEVPAATEMKFRADSDWTLNWGVDLAGGGANISVEAGNYRVYLDFNNGEYSFDEKMYGKEEPIAPAGGDEPEPEPEPEVKAKAGLWSIVGNVNGANDWDLGVYLAASENGLWVSPVTTLDGEFKIRWNNGWDISRVGTVTVGTAFPVASGNGNMKVDKAGDYVVIYDPKAETVTVLPANQGLGMVGDALANGWGDKDTYHLLETSAGSKIYTTVAVLGEGKFKIRQDCDWDSKPNYGGTFKAFGQPFEAVVKGPDIEVKDEKGEYVVGVPVLVTLNLNDNTITIDKLMTGRWGVVGQVNGTNWDSDVLMVADAAGTTFRSMPFVVDGEFKIRKDGAWDVDRVGEFAAFDTPFSVSKGAGNIKGDALKGKSVYLVYDAAAETITISEYK